MCLHLLYLGGDLWGPYRLTGSPRRSEMKMPELVVSLLTGCACGVLLLAFYNLLKMRRGSLDVPILYLNNYGPINYMGIAEFISQPQHRWTKYIIFRTVPFVLATTTAVAFLQKIEYYTLPLSLASIASCLLVSSTPIIRQIISSRIYISIKIFSICIICGLSAIGALVSISGMVLDLRWILPSPQSLRDGLWTAAIAAILVAYYFKATDLSTLNRKDITRAGLLPGDLREFINDRGLRIWRRFGKVIYRESRNFNLDPKMMLSLLVYEDLNRPAALRFLENVIVTITPLSLTVGIAQVKSHRRLKNEESIRLMAVQIADIRNELCDKKWGFSLSDIFYGYNNSTEYAENVSKIYEEIYHDLS